jgi:hypothetical protein
VNIKDKKRLSFSLRYLKGKKWESDWIQQPTAGGKKKQFT